LKESTSEINSPTTLQVDARKDVGENLPDIDVTTVESVDVKETTPPARTSHYSIPEVIDLGSNESDSPEQHDRYSETQFEQAG
jgi:hypothetical protein